jgi:membrane protease YdiL (CAAX protease family)
MKYFRTYPWALQLLLFVLMIYTLFWAGRAMLEAIFMHSYGVTLNAALQVNEHSSLQAVHVAMLAQGVLSIMMFMAPSLLFASFAHPRPLQYIGLCKPRKALSTLLSVMLIITAMPLLVQIEEAMRHVNFGADVKAGQAAAEGIQKAFLTMPTFSDFARTFLVMAIIPAVGEELFFRGILMRFVRQKSRGMVMPIAFTSVFFALVHSNYYGMPSILLAGVLLAVIYYLTGSIWNGILAHLVFNGSQVLLTYLKVMDENASGLHIGVVLSAGVLFGMTLYLLWKNRTPLADDWYKDFDQPKDMEIEKEPITFN